MTYAFTNSSLEHHKYEVKMVRNNLLERAILIGSNALKTRDRKSIKSRTNVIKSVIIVLFITCSRYSRKHHNSTRDSLKGGIIAQDIIIIR